MSRRTDTRMLVGSVYPRILAEGLNPSVAEIKAWVRKTDPALADWNPSDSTVADEIKKLRRTTASLMNQAPAASLPGFPDAVARRLQEAAEALLSEARAAAAEEVAADRESAASEHAAAMAAVDALKSSTEEAARLVEHDRTSLQETFRRLEAERQDATTAAAEAQTALSLLQAETEALRLRLVEAGEQLAGVRADMERESARAHEQIVLAETRYRDLEKIKLMEIDQARVQNDRLRKENEALSKSVDGLRQSMEKLREEHTRELAQRHAEALALHARLSAMKPSAKKPVPARKIRRHLR